MTERPFLAPWATDPAAFTAYDIEADWILMSTCNYRCTYCFWDTGALGQPITPPAGPEQLAAFFDESGYRWLLHLTGGEPFLYPQFVHLCHRLTQHHRISLNTNADSSRVSEFARTIDPKRVDFVNCGLHYQERMRRSRLDVFRRHVNELRDSGFEVYISCVMAPSLFPDFPQIWRQFADEGLYVIPKALQGQHEGLSYPQSYSDEQRALFRRYSALAGQAYESQLQKRHDKPTINPLLDVNYLSGLPDYRGQLCSAGHRFVRIRENGDVRRCGPEDVLGNIAEGWFDRRPTASLCRELECPYFCEKYRIRP